MEISPRFFTTSKLFTGPRYGPREGIMKQYRLDITYWNEPREISMIDAYNVEEAVESLLAGIDSGRVMGFTIEGE